MLTLKIGIEGKTTEDLLDALHELKNKVSELYSSGYDSNESGSYSFIIEGEEEITLEITLEDTVDNMIESIKEQAENFDIPKDDIAELFQNKNVDGLDKLFEDGGEVRCEYFTDLAIEYALQFGEFDSAEFHEARWEAIEKAMKEF